MTHANVEDSVSVDCYRSLKSTNFNDFYIPMIDVFTGFLIHKT